MRKELKKNKTVLLVANCTWYLYNFREELLIEMTRKGYKLILLSPFDKYQKKIAKYFNNNENLFLVRGSENPFIELGTIINIALIYLKYKPDLVHHFTIKPCIYGGFIARLFGIKNIINHITGLGPSFYNSRTKIKFINKILFPFYKYAFNNGKNKMINIFHNNSDKDTFINKKITSKNNAITIEGSGVNIDYFKKSPLKKNNKKIKILFPARIIKEKGIIELINACDDLWNQKYEFTLNIAGEIDKQNRSHINSNTYKQITQNPNIFLLGKCKNMLYIYKKMDIVILPSWREGLSKSLLEAASMSLPIITTDVPGCNNIISHEYSGLLVPIKNQDKLIESIKRYLDNPKLAEKFGNNARKIVSEKFTTKKINNLIIKIYERFLGK